MLFEEEKSIPLRVIKTSESIASLAKALSQFQAEVKNPGNTAVNPFFKSKYAPLPEVLNVLKPILGKYGLSVVQIPYNNDDKVRIVTLLLHESGEWIESEPLELKVEKNTPQGVGSAITYGRRYAISAVLGLSSEEDDDGNANEPKGKKGKTEDTVKVDEDLEKVIASISETAAKLSEQGTKKEDIGDAIKSIFTDAKGRKSANYNAIKDIETAEKVLEALKKIGG